MENEGLGLGLGLGLRRVGIRGVGGVGERSCRFFVGIEGDGDGGSEAGVSGGRFARCVSTDFLLRLKESMEVFRWLLQK